MTQEVFDAAAGAYVHAVGDEVTYEGLPVRAVFGSGWVSVGSGDVRVSSKRPELYVAFADLPPGAAAALDPAEHGDCVTVREKEFKVVAVRPDVENVGAMLVLKVLE